MPTVDLKQITRVVGEILTSDGQGLGLVRALHGDWILFIRPRPAGGRRPVGRERIHGIHLLPQWYALSAPAVEEALHDPASMRWFVGVDLIAAPTHVMNVKVEPTGIPRLRTKVDQTISIRASQRMAKILIAYSTVDGHTLKICRRICGLLESDGHSVALSEIGKGAEADVAMYDKLIVGASIRYGRHREQVYEFVEAHRRSLEQRPNAFFSVNVVARKPGKDTPEGNPYVQHFCRRTRWIPNELGVFAGKIEYSKCGLLDRYMIWFIMWLTKGPTDLRSCVEFTNWSQVDDFARRVSLM